MQPADRQNRTNTTQHLRGSAAMPCDAHRSWKKGDCPSCGNCRCCPPPSSCDPELGRHTCSVSSPTAGSNKGRKKKPSSASSTKKKKRRAPSTPTLAPAPESAPSNECKVIPPPSGPSDKQIYQVGDTVFAEDKSHMLWEAIIKNTKLQPIKKKKKASSSPSSSAAETHEWKYLVHYQGWNARWDRWTDGSDLRPDDPAVRAEAKRRHDEAAEKERERKARQKEKREQAATSSARKRKKSADSSGGEVGMSDDATSDGNTASKSKSGKRRKAAASPTATSTKKTKQGSSAGGRGKSAGSPSKEYVQSALEACCSLPFTLRTILVDDKAKITRLGRYVASGYDDVRSVPNWTPPRMVHVLPSALPVKIVLRQFWKERKKSIKDKAKAAVIRMAKNKEKEEGSDYSDLEADGIADIKERQASEESKWKNFLQGLMDLFDDALAPFLLYNQERTHYLAARMDPKVLKMEADAGGGAAKKPSDVYGAEHLLRLFVRLPQIVASSGTDSSLFPDRASLTNFADCMSDLIIHLQKNKATCFKGRYREPKEIEWTWEEAEVVKQCAVGDEIAEGWVKGQ